MAARPQMLADLLNLVASRTDADHTLREIYGEYACTKPDLSPQQLCSANARLILWLRLLFLAFHQATWSTSSISTGNACMPSADALVVALKFLLAIEEPTHSHEGSGFDWKSLKQCAFLLGLRLLRGPLEQKTYNISVQQLRGLRSHLSQASLQRNGPSNWDDASWLCRGLLDRATARADEPEAAQASFSSIPASVLHLEVCRERSNELL